MILDKLAQSTRKRVELEKEHSFRSSKREGFEYAKREF